MSEEEGTDEPENTQDTEGFDDQEDTPETDVFSSEPDDKLDDELRETEEELKEIREELERIREKEDEIERRRVEIEQELKDHEKRIEELDEEMTDTDREPRGTPRTPRTARAAGVMLGAVGLFGFVASVGAAAVTFVPDVTAPVIDGFATEAVVGATVASALLSLVVLAGGWWSYNERRWYSAVIAAVLSTVLVTPIGLPAFVLVALAEPRFD